MNSSVALREANSHGQGIPFYALFKLEPEERVELSLRLYQRRVLPLSLHWHICIYSNDYSTFILFSIPVVGNIYK